MSDIEIARAAVKKPIQEIGLKLGIPEADLLPFGHDKAKVSDTFIKSLGDREDGKLILVTAINPTPAGEGKTTTTVGLGDGLNAIGKKRGDLYSRSAAWAELRDEGRRGRRRLCAGRADGGDEPPLHRRFPRDHLGALTAERDAGQPHLLGQRVRDRHPPGRLAPVVDMNDRALRQITTRLAGWQTAFPREDGFDITVAQEVMAILCLAQT